MAAEDSMAKHSNSMSKAIHIRERTLHIKCSLKLYNLGMLIHGTHRPLSHMRAAGKIINV